VVESFRRCACLVAGRVQGVGFRYYIQGRAEALGLSGWVRNRSDRKLEFEVQGPIGLVDELLAHSRSGPASARVEEFRVRDIPLVENEQGFTIEV
jgi:acylphosphatase